MQLCQGKLTIRTRSDRGVGVIEVQDNGSGISADALARMFEYGFTTKPDGHGFGLHMSANAAQSMGGALTCASDGSGTGACFTLRLPTVGGEDLVAAA